MPELFEDFVPGEAHLVKEGDRVLHADDLDLLELHHLIGRVRLLDDRLPYVLLEDLVGVSGVRKHRLKPVAGGGDPLPRDFVDLSGSFEEGLVVAFDRLDTAVVAIQLVSTSLIQLPEIALCLGVLVNKCPEPDFGVPDFDLRLCHT